MTAEAADPSTVDPTETTEAAEPAEATDPKVNETDEREDAERAEPEKKQTNGYRALVRKQAKLTREREAFLAEKQAFERERLTVGEERELAARFRKLSDLAAKDKVAAAREFGLDYDELTKAMLEDASLSPAEKATRAEIVELKRERAEAQRKLDEQAAKEQLSRAEARDVEMLRGVVSDVKAYPFSSDLSPGRLLAKARSVVKDAFDAAETKGIKLDPADITYEDVAQVIEQRQAAKANYWRRKLGLTAAQAKDKVIVEEAADPPAKRRTLSSRDSSGSARGETRRLTREERRERAKALIPD